MKSNDLFNFNWIGTESKKGSLARNVPKLQAPLCMHTDSAQAVGMASGEALA